MEENQNKGVDLSHYLDLRKADTFAKLSNLNKDRENNKKKNKIYLAIIIVCFLAMVFMWMYYVFKGGQNSNNAVPVAPAAFN